MVRGRGEGDSPHPGHESGLQVVRTLNTEYGGGGRAEVHPPFCPPSHPPHTLILKKQRKKRERRRKRKRPRLPRSCVDVHTSPGPGSHSPIADHILRDKRFLENPTQADSAVAKPCGHAVATGVGQNPFLESPAWCPRPRSRARPAQTPRGAAPFPVAAGERVSGSPPEWPEQDASRGGWLALK